MNRVDVISWNVNGLRSVARKGWINWLEAEQPDVLCMQEVRVTPDKLDDELIRPLGYKSFFASAEKKGYSGVSVYSKLEPEDVIVGLGDERFDNEGRTITIRYKDFTVVNAYFPNGQRDHGRVPYKLDYCHLFLEYCQRLRECGEQLILCGDFNTAHRPIDLARPENNKNTTGFLSIERDWIDKLVVHGFIDVYRQINGDIEGRYTWWSNRKGVRERNVGWRIDYFFLSPDLISNVKSVEHLSEILGSDHCPIKIELG